MDEVRKSSKEVVRERSGGQCEKCKVNLTRTVHGFEAGLTDRTLHHRQPQRHGGRDSVINMVNLCIRCHREIHEDERAAAREGWIIINRYPGNVPFLSWRGWVLPGLNGSLTLLDFEVGRASPLTPALAPDTPRRRRSSSHRPRRETRRNSSNWMARTA